MVDEVELRKEKVKNFLKNNLNKKIWITLIVYIILLLTIYFNFGKTIKYGQLLLFIIIPAISIVLILLNKIEYALLMNIAAWGFIIRIQNLQFLKDITTNSYIPADPDAMAFLRYAQYILENGKLMAVDTLRYYPIGFTGVSEFSFLAHFIVLLYKFIHFFIPSVTLELIDTMYPAIVFPATAVMFFLLVKKLLGTKEGLLATLVLTIMPAFLFRTTSGVSDKEALGVLLMFSAMYFFIAALKEEKIKKTIFLSVLSAIFTFSMGMTWGGVTLMISVIGLFFAIKIMLNKISTKDVYHYVIWYFLTHLLLISLYSEKYTIISIITSSATLVSLLTFVSLIIYFSLDMNIINLKERIGEKFPLGITSIAATILLGLLAQMVFFGPSFILTMVQNTATLLVKPFATNRWVITVAESHQPFITDWFSNFGRTYFWVFMISAIVLFYDIAKSFNKNEGKKPWIVAGIFALALLGFIFSRYSQSSVFNGESGLALLTYFVSIASIGLIALIPVLYIYYKKKEDMHKFKNINESYLFIVIWFVIMAIAARTAIRLLFVFTPITVIMFGFLIFRVAEKIKKLKTQYIKIALYIILILFTVSIVSDFSKATLNQAQNIGPTYSQQWQIAGKWVRENTPENAVFAHWWDYGYLIQTGMHRATLSDGGNARNAINYFIGRHLLTGHNDTEALELLKANNATNVLIISDEIGKYPAFSSIGSDEDYDRYSWINTFSLDLQNTKETRNGTMLVYSGGTPVDHDFVYKGKIYPRRSTGIGAILVPVNSVTTKNEKNETTTQQNFGQPQAILVFNNQQIEIPMSCLFMQGREFKFENYGLDACLLIIPVIQNNQMNQIGAALYLSPEVYSTLFTKLYLFGKSTEHFKLVYDDSNSMPLAIYNGRLIGPLRIWGINYPEKIDVSEYYLNNEFPNDEVNKINKAYT